MDDLIKGSIVCIPFVLLFLLAPNFIGGSPDYSAHLTMAVEKYNGVKNLDSSNSIYAPLLQNLLAVFSVREKYFQFAAMFMILFVTPLLIILITRSWMGALFYFTTSSYLYFMTAGLFAQALLGIFILGLFATNNIYFRLVLVVFGSISHSFGPIAMLGTLFIILVNENILQKKSFSLDTIFVSAFCSPIWGQYLPKSLGTKIGAVENAPESLSINDVGSFFFKIAPFPFLIIGMKKLIHNREYDFIILFFVSVLAGYFVNVRMLHFAGLISIIGFTKAYPGLQMKRYWFFLAIANGLLLLVQHYILVNKLFCP